MAGNASKHLVEIPEAWNRITERIIAAAIEVHTHLGPGLLESVYEIALARELELGGLRVSRQQNLRCTYKGVDLPMLKLDLLVEDFVVIELKSVDTVHDAHLAQLVSHLRYGGFPLGLVINFNVPKLVLGVHRRIHPPAIAKLVSPPRSSASL